MGSTNDALHVTAQDTTAAVDAFMGRLEHPLKDGIERLRAIIRDADPGIAEGVKWNAPSFRTRDYLATMHLRGKGVGVVLHRGATAKPATQRLAVDDACGLLEWLASDRAMVRFSNNADIENRCAAFQELIRSWIAQA